jgi:hypothetical protein
MPPRTLGGQSKKYRNLINSHKNQKLPAISSISLIIIVIGLLSF